MTQDATMAVPPTQGAKLKPREIVALICRRGRREQAIAG